MNQDRTVFKCSVSHSNMDVCDYTVCNNLGKESTSHGNFESNWGTHWHGNADVRQLACLGFIVKIHKVGLFFKDCPLGFHITTHCVKYLKANRMSAVWDSPVIIQVSRTREVSFRSFCAHTMWNSNIRLELKGHFPNQSNSQQIQ